MSEKERTIRLTQPEIQEHIEAGLENLRDLCRIYDEGRPYVSFSMATEVKRILDSNSYTRRVRGVKNFPTPRGRNDKGNLVVEAKLIVVRFGDNPPVADFLPKYQRDRVEPVLLTFREWWNRDIIHRASAAPPGTPPDMIPLRLEQQIPYDKRKTLVRRIFVAMMRDKLGAHLDDEIPETLDVLQKSHSFGVSLAVTTPAGEFDTFDGTLPVRTGPAAAMMRQISQEVMVAYGLAEIWESHQAISTP